MIIGRDNSADLTISDAEVSRKHARLYKQGATYMLEDLGSTNGSYVNGQRLMGPHALRNGELIMFGENVGLVYEASSFDMDATIAAGPGQFETPPPIVKPSAQDTASQRPFATPTWEPAQAASHRNRFLMTFRTS
jgi:pSer/pThr/pTyr-binding forkhead associated (FHA) protein